MDAKAGKPKDKKETRTIRELRAELRKAGIIYGHARLGTAKDTPLFRIAGIYAPVEEFKVVIVSLKVSFMIRRRIIADVLKVLERDPDRPRTDYFINRKGVLTAQFNPNEHPILDKR